MGEMNSICNFCLCLLLWSFARSYGDQDCSKSPKGTNVALAGHAIQSSNYKGNRFGAPGNAIDGNSNGIYRAKSCSHTNLQFSPWWAVDLMETYAISAITVTGRKDCCTKRILGAEIHIGNSMENNGLDNPVCGRIMEAKHAVPQTFCCNGMEGRYVTIVIPARTEYLTLCEVEVYGVLVTCTNVTTGPNLALGGIATQSSVYNAKGVPEHATDGNRDSNYKNKSCTHTQLQHNPWWRVDLLMPYQISKVVVTNRGDCCSQRLDGAEILIGNSHYLDNNELCATVTTMEPGQTETFCCNGTEGRFVTITIPDRKEYLTLCEVEIYGVPHPCSSLTEETNVALNGVATQSSLYSANNYGAPQNAIDGNRDSNFQAQSCSHTNLQLSPWWRVDLGEPYMISTINITNRGDCCANRLNGTEILIGNSTNALYTQDNYLCGTLIDAAPGATYTFCCNGMVGRYVTIVIPGRTEYLSLCEVEVYAAPLPCIVLPGESNVALVGKATQSSLYSANPYGIPQHAIDGNPDGDFKNTSCMHTELQARPWWRVDLRKPHLISSIVVTGRSDCCSWRLLGAEIHVGNSLQNDGEVNPLCGNITAVEPVASSIFCCNGMEGRYITVIIPSRTEYLTLCEVEVYGIPVPCDLLPSGTNVALDGVATQSSLYSYGFPGHAIDGNKNSAFTAKSCSHTQLQIGPWWRVDLGNVYQITSVAITNRGDCCEQRLNGTEIHIGNYLEIHGNDSLCASIDSLALGEMYNFCCSGMEGRYITILIPSRKESLTLCEVEVFGVPAPCMILPGETNVALKGVATQSSLYAASKGVAQHAIDGNKDSNFKAGFCTQTDLQYSPWWRVDLGAPHVISKVVITNRGDCCSQRLDDAQIFIGNSLYNNEENGLCASIAKIKPGATETFCCNGIEGRYVTIFIPERTDYLTLCEVEVFGVPSLSLLTE